MDRIASEFVDVQWVAQCARRLRRQWPRADLASIEDAARELWQIDWLREMAGDDAAELWLHPLERR
ncbi:MAG: hypothetical protein M3Z15_02355 [Pseudomonadota bacterium]|nr:hypothetical protein [Pseudomonadota bacterium]